MLVYDYTTDDLYIEVKEDGEIRKTGSIASSGQVIARNTREACKLARAEIRQALESDYADSGTIKFVNFKGGPSLTLVNEAEKEEVAEGLDF